ncbi:MAG: peptidase M14, partial [Chlorobi bacterium]|nr:peptidase M14 [Chlorobiota bacterium]
QDVANHITRPDIIALSGPGVKVLAGFVVEDPLLDVAREQKHQPDRIRVETIPGMGTVKVRWIVQGNGEITVTAESVKGGRDELRVR